MALPFRIVEKSPPHQEICQGNFPAIAVDEDPALISVEEAKAAFEWLKTNRQACPSLKNEPFQYTIHIGDARLSLGNLPLVPQFDEVRRIFGHQRRYIQWLEWIEQQRPDSDKLEAYIQGLRLLHRTLGSEDFRKLLGRPFERSADNIIVRKTSAIPGIQDYPDEDALQGFVLDDIPLERMVHAIWRHGDEYGEGKINAPFVSCSQVVKRFPSEDRILQQIVFDFPAEAVLGTIFQLKFNEDKMTLNDTRKRPYAGFGVEIRWDLVKDESIPWACLDEEKGTTFHHNTGLWRLLPVSADQTILWYASEHDVVGMEAPEGASIDALRKNMLAFSRAAHGKYGGETKREGAWGRK